MDEIFKPIEGYPKYYVSNLGNVMSTKRNGSKLMSKYRSRLGYTTVILYNNKKMNTLYVARTVLAAFEGYPDDPWLCYVHHKDGNLENCRLDNLEWKICETTDEYDPAISHRRGVLKPEETKERMSNAKYRQTLDTIRKIILSRQRTMGMKRYCDE